MFLFLMTGTVGAEDLVRKEGTAGGADRPFASPSRDECLLALAGFEKAVLDACTEERGEWPGQIAAGIYAGVDFAIAHPVVGQTLTFDGAVEGDSVRQYERLIGRLAGFLQIKAPPGTRLSAATDEVLVAGIVGLVGDHIRIGRVERLAELRPELVMLTLLPYLGMDEARRWSQETERSRVTHA
jgi:hypothetical protein